MAKNRTLSVPSLRVNNDVIDIIPNSFMYKPGDGEVNVRAVSSGGGGSKSVHSVNAETQISSGKFDLAVTDVNRALVRGWKENVGSNTIEAVEDGTTIPFKNISITNDPEVNATSDGVLAVEFAGDKLA